jgi:chromosome segregation ATPase
MTMARRTPAEDVDMDERLEEAQAQIESLQAGAADAEARAATAREELEAAREARTAAEAAREETDGELARLRLEVEDGRSRLAEAAVKYREAKLASAPEVPADLVPPAESLAEIDEGFESARRVVGHLRERMQEERQAARVPVGSPVRRGPDLSSLSHRRRSRWDCGSCRSGARGKRSEVRGQR